MIGLQELIHKIEEGEGARFLRLAALVLLLLSMTLVYDLREFRNWTAPEAMDAAQLGRNLAEGKGFTTDYIRPLSMYLVKQSRTDGKSLLSEGHPDISNPPLYPLLLAGLMKVLPFNYEVAEHAKFASYQPEMLIAYFNQILFFCSALWLFFIARKLFDNQVAWLTIALYLFSDLYWRFSISGLSSNLLILLLLGVVWSLLKLEENSSVENASSGKCVFWAVLAGAFLGAMAMTRYSMIWLFIPTLCFVMISTGNKKWINAVAVGLVFIAICSPWLLRNYGLSGKLFGTASYAIFQDTPSFSGDSLERSLELNSDQFKLFGVEEVLRKLVVNLHQIVQVDLPRFGGNWFSAFFLVGLLIQFRKPTLVRLRIFTVIAILIMAVVQALGKTRLSYLNPEISSENLLFLLGPLVLMYGAALYYTLLEQINFAVIEFRRLISVGVVVIASLPLILTVLPPRSTPLAYPPYWPWLMREINSFMQPQEMMMSDAPWAVSWYADRQCVLLPQNPGSDFIHINDFQKTVHALYITQLSLDERFLTGMVKGNAWGRFILESIVINKLPDRFPLRHAWADLLFDQLFLADSQRWAKKKP